MECFTYAITALGQQITALDLDNETIRKALDVATDKVVRVEKYIWDRDLNAARDREIAYKKRADAAEEKLARMEREIEELKGSGKGKEVGEFIVPLAGNVETDNVETRMKVRCEDEKGEEGGSSVLSTGKYIDMCTGKSD